MDSNDWIQIGILVLLIALSAFFSSSETAFSSVNNVKLKYLIQNGHKKAVKTLKLSENFESVLTTLLIGNNIVNILAASLATLFFVKHINEQAGPAIATAVMTILVLIFGEITPKSYAKRIPEKYAMAVTPILVFFMYLLKPLEVIFGSIQKIITKTIKTEEQPISEDELLTYVSEVQSEGGINENEEELISRVIDFDDLLVKDILTPRMQVIAIRTDDDSDKIISAFKRSGYSRLPVYDTNIDHIVGVVNHKDFYNKVLLDKASLEDIIVPAMFVTEYMKIVNLLDQLRSNKSHMAIVKDEFGGTIGIVTMEDILEELVGDIWDEHDEIVEQITKVNETEYRVKGHTEIDILFETLNIEIEHEYATVSGWVVDTFGHIPFIGESFQFANLFVTVTSSDTKKVLEVLIKVQNIEEELEENVE
ncbi:MAG: hemolysin family protein [Acholeplasmataceae bacterium]